MTRVGVLGGMFDPIHLGHECAAVDAQHALALDRLIVVPSHQPPHRPEQPCASAADRLAMASLVAAAHPSWSASDMEIARAGPSYTYDTLAELATGGLTPPRIYFITGADAFAAIATWSRYPAVLDLAHFVVVARPGTTLESLRKRLPDLAGRMVTPGHEVPGFRPQGTSIVLLETATPDVSSTEIRRRAQAGLSIAGMVPDAVASYIATHRLYVAPGL